MNTTPERLEAAVKNIHNLANDKPARTVLALNDAAIKSGTGRFFYLPERQPTLEEDVKVVKGHVEMISAVPRLLYADQPWSEEDQQLYGQLGDADRHWFSQTGLMAQLNGTNVVPINLIIQDHKTSSLTWHAQSIASLVIYGPGPWYKLSSMQEWTAKASKDTTKETCTIPMYSQALVERKKKKIYYESGNAIGRTLPTEEIPSQIREMVRESDADNQTSSWIRGTEIITALTVEAEVEGGGAIK